MSSYREQPKVALTYQVLAILEGVTEDPDTHTQEHLTIVQTTLPSRIQHLLQENTRASQFKVGASVHAAQRAYPHKGCVLTHRYVDCSRTRSMRIATGSQTRFTWTSQRLSRPPSGSIK